MGGIVGTAPPLNGKAERIPQRPLNEPMRTGESALDLLNDYSSSDVTLDVNDLFVHFVHWDYLISLPSPNYVNVLDILRHIYVTDPTSDRKSPIVPARLFEAPYILSTLRNSSLLHMTNLVNECHERIMSRYFPDRLRELPGFAIGILEEPFLGEMIKAATGWALPESADYKKLWKVVIAWIDNGAAAEGESSELTQSEIVEMVKTLEIPTEYTSFDLLKELHNEYPTAMQTLLPIFLELPTTLPGRESWRLHIDHVLPLPPNIKQDLKNAVFVFCAPPFENHIIRIDGISWGTSSLRLHRVTFSITRLPPLDTLYSSPSLDMLYAVGLINGEDEIVHVCRGMVKGHGPRNPQTIYAPKTMPVSRTHKAILWCRLVDRRGRPSWVS
ncbi:hypothetical protein HKX48_002466 [Thoreauomyces humboldtii]|nr:hypothetical protein HKX48_002466 [Thoreauomyces humboldtii]